MNEREHAVADERDESEMRAFELMQANQLRTECRRRKVTPVSHKKSDYLDALRLAITTARAIVDSGAVGDPQKYDGRKTVDCVFRLLNVLFSDEFCERFAHHGDLATRADLDTKAVGSESEFRVDVSIAYNDEDLESFNRLNHVKDCFINIDAACFRQHERKKLWGIWTDVCRAYRDAYGKFTMSGNHGPFEGFTQGRLDLLYLHLLTTKTRPKLHACVIQSLPDNVQFDSLLPEGGSNRTNSAKPTPEKMKSDEIAHALKEMANNPEKTELTKRQIDFLSEDLSFKRKRHVREGEAHLATMKRGLLQEKKDRFELLIALQRSIAELRESRKRLIDAGVTHTDEEAASLNRLILKLTRDREPFLLED